MILERITWPGMLEDHEDEEDDCSLDDKCRVAGYLRSFIENGKVHLVQFNVFQHFTVNVSSLVLKDTNSVPASPANLKELMKFWTGWEVPPKELLVEVVDCRLPKSSTCV